MDVTSYLLGKKNGGVTPTGEVDINSNGVHNVSGYATANVQVPQPSGTINITENGITDVTNYASANVSVPVPVQEKDVNFYDIDGTLLYSYTLQEAQELTELPPAPTQEGLTFQEWNWDLADIKAENGQVDVGATYISNDGKTRLFVELDEYTLNPTVSITVSGSVEIDWGDGSAIETFTQSGNKTHSYQQAGNYTITFNPIDDSTFSPASHYSRYKSLFFCYATYLTSSNYQYVNNAYYAKVKKLIIGKGFGFGELGLNDYNNLKIVNIPNHITSFPTSFLGNIYLPIVVFPKNLTSVGNSFCAYSYIEKFILNNKNINFGSGFLNYGYLKKLKLYNSASYTINNICTEGCIEEATLTENISATGTLFSNSRGMKKIIIKNFSNNRIGSMFLKTLEGSFAKNICNDFLNNSQNVDLVPPLINVETIGNNAFSVCSNLANINLGTKLQSIGTSAFVGCSSLTKLTFPSTLTSIGDTAFNGCQNIFVYDFSACEQIPTLGTNAFQNNSKLQKIIVPDALYNDWIAANNWSTYASYIVKASEA